MQVLSESTMQDEASDASIDEDGLQVTKQPQEAKHITIDFADMTPRYQDVYPLGCGANAVIFSAVDQQCHKRLAVKKVALKNCTSTVVFRQLFREIRVLRHLDHDNVIKIYHTLVSTHGRNSDSPVNSSENHDLLSSQSPLSAVYMGLELMDTDLQNVLMQRKLSSDYSKLFTYQMLRGLKYIHSANVIHRDVTPSNIFLNMDTLMLKIGDFGVCRIFDEDYDHSGHLSMASSSTRYQAPELLLHPRHYNKAVDLWAAGCIFAEMLGGKPLFDGECSYEQINLILNSVSVTSEMWASVAGMGCKDKRCCADAGAYGIRENGGRPELPLCDILPQAPPMAINLLQKLLAFDPADRIKATDALLHPFLSNYSQTSDEPVCHQPFRIEDELDDFSYAKYQHMLRREASSYTSSVSLLHDTSTEDSTLSSRFSKASICQTDSYKNLVALVQSEQPSNGSNHSNAITESEARTIACDFDYGVQITDGSVNRERLCLDFEPAQSSTACFDPYKWDHHGGKARKDLEIKANSDINLRKVAAAFGLPDGSTSDHGYASYCSSNHSHGRLNLGSMWSLSSPDISIDHDRFGGSHRVSTPEVGDHTLLPCYQNEVLPSDTRHSPVCHLDEKSGGDVMEPRRRHKEDVPRHHQNYGHYHHHHHHHHHHHKHHRHSSRHVNVSFPDKHQHQRSSSSEGDGPSNGPVRFQQRRCVVNEVVPEAAEEGTEVKDLPFHLEKRNDNWTMLKFDHNDKKPTERSARKTRDNETTSSNKPSAPSERLQTNFNSQCASVLTPSPPPCEATTTESANVKHADCVVSTESDNVDESFNTVDRTNVSTFQNGYQQCLFGGAMKRSPFEINYRGAFTKCYPTTVEEYRRPYSIDLTMLERVAEGLPAGPKVIDPVIDSIPQKCSSSHPKPPQISRRQVECPF